MRILQVDTFSEPQAQANCQGLLKAYGRVGETAAYDYRAKARELGVGGMNADLVRFALGFKPDVVHFDKCELVAGETARKIRNGLPGAFLYQLFGDLRPRVQPYVAALAPHVDRTLFYYEDERHFKMHEEAGCRRCSFWPNGADPDVFRPHRVPKRHDVLFYGNGDRRRLTKERVRFLKALVSADFSVRLLGEKWDRWFKGGISRGPFTDLEPLAREISAARVALAFNQNHVRLYTSWRRPLACMAAGAFVLTRYFPGLETVFEDGKHLVWFRETDEGVDKARYYANRPHKREKIAERGRAEVLAKHTWDYRVAQVLEWAKRTSS